MRLCKLAVIQSTASLSMPIGRLGKGDPKRLTALGEVAVFKSGQL